MSKEIISMAMALHDTLMASIARIEALAQECAAMATLAEQDGNQGFADVLRSLSRKHRVELLEIAGQVALLKAEFGGALRSEAR